MVAIFFFFFWDTIEMKFECCSITKAKWYKTYSPHGSLTVIEYALREVVNKNCKNKLYYIGWHYNKMIDLPI